VPLSSVVRDRDEISILSPVPGSKSLSDSIFDGVEPRLRAQFETV